MRRLGLILLLSAPALLGAGMRSNFGQNVRTNGVEILLFAPPDGTGLPVTADLCDTYSSEMIGSNMFCLRGDGTTLSGSQALTATAGPTTQVLPTCFNGPNCGNTTGQRLDGATQDFRTVAQASPTGSWSVCASVMLDDTINRAVMEKSDVAANQLSIRWETAANGSLTMNIYKTDGVNTGTVSSILSPGVEYFLCSTYQFVTDGTSVLTPYINGVVDGTPVTNALGPVQAASASRWQIGSRFNTPGEWVKGRYRNAFMTEKVLSPATVVAMSHTALADVQTGSNSETVSFTRNSNRFCTNQAESAGSWLTKNRMCISNGGANVEGFATTNLMIRSNAFDNAAWTKTNVTAPTADTDFAPDGTITAEVLTNSGAAGFIEGTAANISGSDGAASVFCKTAAGTQTMSIALRDLTASVDRCTASITASPTYQRVGCFTQVAVNGNSHTMRIYPGGTSGIAGNSVICTDAMMQNVAGPTSYILTAGTSATKVIETGFISLPFSPSGDVSTSGDVVQQRLSPHVPWSLGLGNDERLVPIYQNTPGVSVWQLYGRELITGYIFPGSNFTTTPVTGTVYHLVFWYQNSSRASQLSVYDGTTLVGTSNGGARTIDIADLDRVNFQAGFSNGWTSTTRNICVSRSVTGCQ